MFTFSTWVVLIKCCSKGFKWAVIQHEYSACVAAHGWTNILGIRAFAWTAIKYQRLQWSTDFHGISVCANKPILKFRADFALNRYIVWHKIHIWYADRRLTTCREPTVSDTVLVTAIIHLRLSGIFYFKWTHIWNNNHDIWYVDANDTLYTTDTESRCVKSMH